FHHEYRSRGEEAADAVLLYGLITGRRAVAGTYNDSYKLLQGREEILSLSRRSSARATPALRTARRQRDFDSASFAAPRTRKLGSVDAIFCSSGRASGPASFAYSAIATIIASSFWLSRMPSIFESRLRSSISCSTGTAR